MVGKTARSMREYGAPEANFCPAGVYEYPDDELGHQRPELRALQRFRSRCRSSISSGRCPRKSTDGSRQRQRWDLPPRHRADTDGREAGLAARRASGAASLQARQNLPSGSYQGQLRVLAAFHSLIFGWLFRVTTSFVSFLYQVRRERRATLRFFAGRNAIAATARFETLNHTRG